MYVYMSVLIDTFCTAVIVHSFQCAGDACKHMYLELITTFYGTTSQTTF